MNEIIPREELTKLANIVREKTGICIMDAKKLLITNNCDIDLTVNMIKSTPLEKLFPGRLFDIR